MIKLYAPKRCNGSFCEIPEVLQKESFIQGKKCARLAVLLGVETPVATALSLCALSALMAHDERYLGKYIHEVIAKVIRSKLLKPSWDAEELQEL